MTKITDSILSTIKKMVGIEESYEAFDTDIIVHINATFSILNQIGVGPKDGFFIEDATATWNQFIEYINDFEFVKSYIYIKVRLIFDPPSNSFVLDSLKRQADELEWRLKLKAEERDKNEQSK